MSNGEQPPVFADTKASISLCERVPIKRWKNTKKIVYFNTREILLII